MSWEERLHPLLWKFPGPWASPENPYYNAKNRRVKRPAEHIYYTKSLPAASTQKSASKWFSPFCTISYLVIYTVFQLVFFFFL